MEYITDEQRKSIEQLRKNTMELLPQDKLNDERYLLTWLTARNGNVSMATKMIKEHLLWRKVYRVDTLLTDYTAPEICSKYYSSAVIGVNKEGYPIIITRLGRLDCKGLYQTVKWSDIIKTPIYVMEQSMHLMKQQSKKLGRTIDQCIAILDAENVTLRACFDAKDFFVNESSMEQNNYPELLKRVYIINASTFFYSVLELAKQFIDTKTLKKIRVFGSEGWKDVLLKDIDPEVLPVHWGGTRTDGTGDPTCPTVVPIGGEIPKSLIMSPKERLSTLSDLKTVSISGRSVGSIDIDVLQPGSILRWIFYTEERGIFYAVYRKNLDEFVELCPLLKANSHLVPEDGQVFCKTAGTYTIQFDNSKSYLWSTKVTYKLEIINNLPTLTEL